MISTVYAKNSNDVEIVGLYSDDSYMFDLGGLYDNEEISVYSDQAMTNLLGVFRPRISKKEYTIGEPSLGLMRTKSMVLSAPATESDAEMAEITKEEYDSLVSRVNQLVKIIKKLTK